MKTILLTLTIILSLNLLAQDTTRTIHPDSCICYTDDMDKKALECLVNAPKKDSIISNQSLEIINFKTVIRNDAVMKTDLRVANEKLQAETHQLNLKLARVKKNTPYIGVGCFSLGVGTAIFIYKKVVK